MNFPRLISLLTAFSVPLTSMAATIEIHQISPTPGYYSEWILMKPNNQSVEGRHSQQTLHDVDGGVYSILVDPLEGATAYVKIEINGEVEEDNDYPQGAFTLGESEHATITIENVYTRVGKVSVRSNPPGLKFRIEGPNNFREGGVTNTDFIGVPAGLYNATFESIEGCIDAVTRSDRLEKDSRISLSLTLDCANIEYLEQTQNQMRALQFVTVKIDGEDVVFEDTPSDSWFATFVGDVLKKRIMSGYKNNQGNLMGEFGPSDPVTIAQLVKIAHEVAGIDETKARSTPINVRARNQWFTQYFASAENRGWQVFKDARLNPGRKATRAEVITTVLQALSVPRKWPTSKMFTDVTHDTLYASSIETAAADGVMSGYSDALGNPTGEFKPNAPINRAEMAKLISLAMEVYKEDTAEIQNYHEMF